MNVCFFGASVSEQNVNHSTNEVTGYVTAFVEEYVSNGFVVNKVTSGSNSIDDAGVIYTHKVISSKPDICILDWCTPAPEDCLDQSIDFIFYELLKNKILPIVLILPRADRRQSDTAIYHKLKNRSEDLGIPFWDFEYLFKKSDLKKILKDDVHTTPVGAKLYAEEIHHRLKCFNLTGFNYIANIANGNSIFSVVSPNVLKNSNKTKNILLKIKRKTLKNYRIKLFLEQRVGPWSSFINVYEFEENKKKYLHEKIIFDVWCWRERQCLKGMSNWIDIKPSTTALKLEVNNKIPHYSNIADKADFDSYDKHLRPKGDFYILLEGSEVEPEFEISYL